MVLPWGHVAAALQDWHQTQPAGTPALASVSQQPRQTDHAPEPLPAALHTQPALAGPQGTYLPRSDVACEAAGPGVQPCSAAQPASSAHQQRPLPELVAQHTAASAPLQPCSTQPDFTHTARRAARYAVAVVLSPRSWASGVLVSASGYCLTNAHLFPGGSQPRNVSVHLPLLGSAVLADVVHVFAGA